MKTKRAIFLLFLGIGIAAITVALFSAPVTVRAQCDPAVDPNCQPPPPGCFDAQGLPCTPTPQPPLDNNPPPAAVHTKTPPPTTTNTPTDTPASIAMNTAAPTGTAVPPTATATAVPLCTFCGKTSPWLLGGGVFLLLGLAGVLLLVFRGPLGLGPSGKPGGTDPFPGGSENGTVMPPDFSKDNVTITTPDGSDLGGGMESITITVRDGSDISPDVVSNAREAASDPGGINWGDNPGGVQQPPGSPVKPPKPSIGNKPNGGT